MTDRDKDLDETSETDDELPGDEEFEEEPEEAFEGEPSETGEGEVRERTSIANRFTLGRGGRFEEAEKRQMGSVRGTHERIHIDDRPSTVYALVCAVALIGVLAAAWLGGVLPQPAGPTLTPLVVPTAQATPIGNASASITVSPSASVAPTATPTATPTVAPTATAS